MSLPMKSLSLAAVAGASLAFVLAVAPDAGAALTPDVRKDILIHEQSRNLDDGVLMEHAVSEDAEIRTRALHALGRIQDPSTIDVMSSGLSSDDPAVRYAAAFALGQLFDPASQPALLTALSAESSPDLQATLLLALGKSGDDAAIGAILPYLEAADPVTGPAAAQALGHLAQRGFDLETAGKTLSVSVAHKNPEIAWRSGFAIQRGRVKGAFLGVKRALKSDDVLTRLYATRAAGALQMRNLIDPLIPLLKDPDWRVRVETVKALRAIKIPPAWEGKISLLLEDPSDHLRLEAIGHLSELDALRRTRQFQTSSDWRLRAAYLKALPRASGQGAFVDLRAASRDPNWRIRQAAAEAFDAFVDEQGLVLLEPMVKDEMPAVQIAAINSAIGFPQLEALKFMRGALTEADDTAVIAAAAAALGQRMDREAVGPLIEAYDPLVSPIDSDAMAGILTALGEILVATDDDGAAGILSNADRKRAHDLLEGALEDADTQVAGAAFASLAMARGDHDAVYQPPPMLPPTLDVDMAVALESATDGPIARLLTSRGEVVIELAPQAAPGTVANFVRLARDGFYNGLMFHRVVSDFVVQTGDPRGDGWGGPGYSIRCEYSDLPYATGTVGMAHAGKDTGGSQFFITHSPQPHLEGRYTVFGRVLEGQDVVDRIRVGDTIQEVLLEGF